MITEETALQPSARQSWMGLLARAKPERLAELFPDLPNHSFLRAPEIGAVMVRGRIGGIGQPFNLGEMTITRCSLCLTGADEATVGAPAGAIGHSHIQGRNKAHAIRAAAIDALMQTDRAEALRKGVLDPLASEESVRRHTRAAKAAATKVEFFTLVRGEDK